jgi:uncharacterized protein (UPF0264 family)
LVQLLASVTDAAEADLCAACSADIVDGKDPAAGAVGALPDGVLRAIVAAVDGRCPVSATIGDLPPDPGPVVAAVEARARTGVDIVKIAFFPGEARRATIAALGALALPSTRLVGMLLADREPDFGLIPAMAAAGFAGVMVDTAEKAAGPLTAVWSHPDIAGFIATAHAAGLFAGLAGSLRAEDVPDLLALGPDLLGFRGALCRAGSRVARIEPARLAAIRGTVPRPAATTPRRRSSRADTLAQSTTP